MNESTVQGMTSEQGAAPMSENQSFINRVVNVFVAPSKAFAGQFKSWEWMVAAVIVAALSVTALYLQHPYALNDIYTIQDKELAKLSDQLSAKQIEESKEMARGFIGFILKPSFTRFLVDIPMTAIVLLLWSAIGMLIGNFMFGGQAKFSQLLAVSAFAYLIGGVGDIALAGLVALKGSSFVYIGLGMIKPTYDGSFLFNFLRMLGFFSMWKYAVLSIGYATVYGMPSKKFMLIIIPIWIIFAALGATSG